MSVDNLFEDALALLKKLISIQSFSREEDKTADLIYSFLIEKSIQPHRKGNNVWAFNQYFDKNKPTILLNSHHDTVKPNKGYTKDPYNPEVVEDKLYGLGSNDAGGCLVSLINVFVYFYSKKDLKYNFVLAATAEEEISGANGIESILPDLGEIEFAIVGEPTQMHLAVAEKGLMVLDCYANGVSGHAARNEGENAIYKALKDIQWFKDYSFTKVSPSLGPVKMSVTVINAGTQHNVVPDLCHFVVDVRSTDAYTNEEVLKIIKQFVTSEIKPRSTRLKPSFIPLDFPIIQKGIEMGRNTYGSPTLSDQALLAVPSLKCGPGDSSRSHTADEYIFIHEIEEGIKLYIEMLEGIN